MKEARAQARKTAAGGCQKIAAKSDQILAANVGEATQDRIVENADTESQHTYSHVENSGEMNHTGHYLCDHCEGEMRIVTIPAVPDADARRCPI